MDSNWIVIAISGVTCGGKSVLAKHLHGLLEGSVLISQDDYFLDPKSPKIEVIPELNHGNWEIASSIDHEALCAKIVEVCESRPLQKRAVLIVEGHILFNIPSLGKLLDKKYFFTLNKEECWSRRRVRVYDPPDPPGYFDKCVWPTYLKHKDQMDSSDIVYIDGTENPQQILRFVADDIRNTLSIDCGIS